MLLRYREPSIFVESLAIYHIYDQEAKHDRRLKIQEYLESNDRGYLDGTLPIRHISIRIVFLVVSIHLKSQFRKHHCSCFNLYYTFKIE